MSAPTLIYVPRDAAALAMDADAVAAAIELAADERGLAVQVVRNGSRGLLWLEPLVEIATPEGRLAYGPVQPEDVPALFDAGWLTGGAHPLGLGLTEEIPYLKQQERLTFARVGVIDPLSLQDYAAHGGLQGLKRALAMEPAAIVEEMVTSGLRGRGGAAFPTGIKWKTVLGSPADRKYIVCNADEGDSGTFAAPAMLPVASMAASSASMSCSGTGAPSSPPKVHCGRRPIRNLYVIYFLLKAINYLFRVHK